MDIKQFLSLAGDSVIEAIEDNGLERLGHDIWLTRNGHGAGFFDHSYDDENEKRLISAAKSLKEVDLYINDDMKLSFGNEHMFEGNVKKLISKKLKGFAILQEMRIFVKKDMTQPAVQPIVKPDKTKPKEPVRPEPSRINKPFQPDVTPGTETKPKA